MRHSRAVKQKPVAARLLRLAAIAALALGPRVMPLGPRVMPMAHASAATERHHQRPAPAAAAEPRGCIGGWHSNSPLGPGGWQNRQAVAPYSFRLVASPRHRGRDIARIEVRPGDDPLGLGTERAEVATLLDRHGRVVDETQASGTKYYAFSVKLAANWQPPANSPDGRWAIVLQLHGPDAYRTNPAFALLATNRFVIGMRTGNLDAPGSKIRSYPLSDSALDKGHWVDFIFRIKFAIDDTGALAVWRRDAGQTRFAKVLDVHHVPTLQYRGSDGRKAGDHYWKLGLYRDAQTSIVSVLWIGGFYRGDSFHQVYRCAFGH